MNGFLLSAWPMGLLGAVSSVNERWCEKTEHFVTLPYDLFSPVSETINQGDN